MMAERTYDNASQQRGFALAFLLAGHELQGLSPSDIAKALKVNPPLITRDLHNLTQVGAVEKIETTGRYRLGPRLVRVALAHLAAMDEAEKQLAHIKNKYSRES